MPFGARYLGQLFRRMGTSLAAGLAIRDVLEREAKRGHSSSQHVMRSIADHVDAGGDLATGMRNSRAFPSLACSMADVGEQTGKLDRVLLQLANHYDHVVNLRRTLIGALIWPGLQLILALALVGLVIWLVGELAPMTGGEPVDVLGFGLIGRQGLAIYTAIVGGVLAFLASLVFGFARGYLPSGWVVRIPILGSGVKMMALSRFCSSLAMAHDAGMAAATTMTLALQATENGYFSNHIPDVEARLSQRMEMHEALRPTGAFPEEMLDALETGELSGAVTETMAALGEDYRRQAETASHASMLVLAFSGWALVAAFIIFLIFRFAFFYLGIIDDALNGF